MAITALLVWTLTTESIRQNGTLASARLIGEALKLTHPGEVIIDGKGECVYRPRAWYMIFETIARNKIRSGLMKDDLIEKVIEARAPVAHGFERMTDQDVAWFHKNYLPIGYVYILGKRILPSPDGAYHFELEVPQNYAVVTNRGSVSGTMDGAPFHDSAFLAAGPHTFVPDKALPKKMLFVEWAHAAELGCHPVGQEYAE